MSVTGEDEMEGWTGVTADSTGIEGVEEGVLVLGKIDCG